MTLVALAVLAAGAGFVVALVPAFRSAFPRVASREEIVRGLRRVEANLPVRGSME